MNTTISKHAECRMNQRGFGERDIELIVGSGTLVGGDSVLLLDKDVEREVRRRKEEIARLERLRGTKIVLTEGTVVTIYRPTKKMEKRILRGNNCG